MGLVTTRVWRWVLGGLLGLNLAAAALGWETVCCTLRELFHLERKAGRVGLVLVTVGVIAWWLPHMLNPAKRPGLRRG